MTALPSFKSLTIRNKLLVMVLVPLLVVMPLLGLIVLVWSNEAVDRLLVTKVRSDLAVAQGYFERVLADAGPAFTFTAENRARLDEILTHYPQEQSRSAVLPSGSPRSGASPAGSTAPKRLPRCCSNGTISSGWCSSLHISRLSS